MADRGWTLLADYDARNDEHWVRAGTYYVVTPDYPVDELEEQTTVVVAEVEVLEYSRAERLCYRVERLQRHDGLVLPEEERDAYESVPDWLYHGNVYETPQEARLAAWEATP